jgi:hypothetical protein
MADSQVKNTSLSSLSWMIDNWINEDSNGVTKEQWTKIDENKYEGKSFTIKDGDTVFSEELMLEKKGNDVYYTAVVKHNPAPVSFKMIEYSDKHAVFENQEHDFPQKISYKLQYDGSLLAWIEGKNSKGVYSKIEFPYKREK